jgi:heptosyltransferase-2
LSTPKRILVRLPTWVGDVVMATPAIRAVATANPQAEIICEGRPVLRDLVEGLPGITGFVVEHGKRMRDLPLRVRMLREHHFDWALVLPDSHRSALGPWLARIPVRVGYANDVGRRLMLSQSLPVPMENGKRLPVSMVDRYLKLSRLLGCPDDGEHTQVPVREENHANVRAMLLAQGMPPGTPYLSAVPGASFGASKLWPAEHFAAAADALYKSRGLPLVMAPGPGEEPIAHAIAGAMSGPCHVLADPVIGLLNAAAMIAGSELCISNDTGPRHFAVAAGVPVVVPIGPTDSRHTDHQLETQRVLREPFDCAPCGLKICPIDHRCMTQLLPERIVQAAEELLEAKA